MLEQLPELVQQAILMSAFEATAARYKMPPAIVDGWRKCELPSKEKLGKERTKAQEATLDAVSSARRCTRAPIAHIALIPASLRYCSLACSDRPPPRAPHRP